MHHVAEQHLQQILIAHVLGIAAERVRGRVVKAATKTEEQSALGRLQFQDQGGTVRTCAFSADQVWAPKPGSP